MLHATSKVYSLTFINVQENYQMKLPTYISTHIKLFHSIKQFFKFHSLTQVIGFYLKPGFYMIAMIAAIAELIEQFRKK